MFKKFIFLILLFGLSTPVSAQSMAEFLSAQVAQEDTSPTAGSCQTAAFQTGAKSAYWYIPCLGGGATPAWTGGNTFEWRFVSVVPGWITTEKAHVQVVFESRYDYSGGFHGLSFNVAGVVQDAACNQANSRAFCSGIVTTDLSFGSYATTATNSPTGGACVGGTNDNTACSVDGTCTGGGICISRVQTTTIPGTAYTMQKVAVGSDTVQNCAVGGGDCAGNRIVWQLQYDKLASNIDRGFRVLGIIVTYSQ